MPTTFVAVYRGDTVQSARLIALSADPALVADVVTRMLDRGDLPEDDPIVAEVDRGRRTALRLIKNELDHA